MNAAPLASDCRQRQAVDPDVREEARQLSGRARCRPVAGAYLAGPPIANVPVLSAAGGRLSNIAVR